MVREPEKPHDLLSESWITRKTSGVFQYKSEGLRVGRADDVSTSWSESKGLRRRSTEDWGQEEMEVSAQGERERERERERESALLLPLPFCSIQSLSRGDNVHRMLVRVTFFTWMLISSRDSLTDTPRNNVNPAVWAALNDTWKLTITHTHHWLRWWLRW